MGNERVLVADVMTVDPIVVSVDATLDEADMIVRSTFVIGVPVVDGNGILVGVIGDAHLAAHRYSRPIRSAERSRATAASARSDEDPGARSGE